MISLREKIRLQFIKIFRYEFWPYYIFYFPAFFYGFILALRSGSLAYYTAVNPAMKYSGAFGMSKAQILNSLDPKYKPITLRFENPFTLSEIEKQIKLSDLNYPVIAKPDVGERGVQVEKINDKTELELYISYNKENLIIQEFVDFKNEIGVLYYRFPYEKDGHITSLVKRKFLEIEGDGIHSVLDLMKKNLRATMRLSFLISKFAEKLNDILPKGEKLMLEPIGNHNRGTEFLNGNELINKTLIKVFDNISKSLEGFYYGRYDLKFKSFEDLYQGKNIKILEINGVNSEPAHIYDPDYRIVSAYKDVFKHMRIIYLIGKYNHKNGIKYASMFQFFKEWKAYMQREK